MRFGQGAAVLSALCARAWAGGTEGEITVGPDCGFVVRGDGAVRVDGDIRAEGRLAVQGRLEPTGHLRSPRAEFAPTAVGRFEGGGLHRLEVPELPRVVTESVVVARESIVAVAPATGSVRHRTEREGVASRPLPAAGSAAGTPAPPETHRPPPPRSKPSLSGVSLLPALSPVRDGSSRGPPVA